MPKLVIQKHRGFPPVSEEMAHLSDLLTQELLGWPCVAIRPMFGMRAFYRGPVIFAILPGKRALHLSGTIAFKISDASAKTAGEQWESFELANESAVGRALAGLDRAYRSAAAIPTKPTPAKWKSAQPGNSGRAEGTKRSSALKNKKSTHH